MGDIVITITKLKNVEIYLNAGASKTDATKVVVKEPEENAPVTEADPEKTYKVSVWDQLFMTVLPAENAEETSFEITY